MFGPQGVYLLQRGSKFFSTSLKYLDPGVQILRSIWTGGNLFGGVHFFRNRSTSEALALCVSTDNTRIPVMVLFGCMESTVDRYDIRVFHLGLLPQVSGQQLHVHYTIAIKPCDPSTKSGDYTCLSQKLIPESVRQIKNRVPYRHVKRVVVQVVPFERLLLDLRTFRKYLSRLFVCP